MSWTPLLTGGLAERAMARAREIAVAHAAAPAAREPDRVLYWAYTCAAFDEPFANDAYDAALDALVAWIGNGAPHLGLFGGLANAGWVLCHTLDADDTEDSLGAIDDALLGVMATDDWRGAHDLIEGLVGFGVYFLERLGHGGGQRPRDGLERVVTLLEQTAMKTADGATWHTPLSLLPLSFAEESPDGFFDCGIAHGVPGMIGMLARAARYVPAPASALALEARRWLASVASEVDGRPTYPGKVLGTVPTRQHAVPARTAWCYGDPGVALGLWQAARELASTDAPEAASHVLASTDAPEAASHVLGSMRDAEALALGAMRDADPDAAGVKDATLCHGAAGLGHLCNRFFYASGNAAFADAARAWLARALAMPLPDEAAFLDGSAGVGLALVAAATASEPAWDRLLLSDLAPPTADAFDEG